MKKNFANTELDNEGFHSLEIEEKMNYVGCYFAKA